MWLFQFARCGHQICDSSILNCYDVSLFIWEFFHSRKISTWFSKYSFLVDFIYFFKASTKVALFLIDEFIIYATIWTIGVVQTKIITFIWSIINFSYVCLQCGCMPCRVSIVSPHWTAPSHCACSICSTSPPRPGQPPTECSGSLGS